MRSRSILRWLLETTVVAQAGFIGVVPATDDPSAPRRVEPTLVHPTLTARVTFGEAGAVRFLVTVSPTSDANPRLGVEIDNEGAVELAVTSEDAWSAITTAGIRIPLVLDDKRLVARPGQFARSELHARAPVDAPIAKVVCRSGALEREVEIAAEFRRPRPLRVVPALWDPRLAPAGGPYSLQLAAIVSAEGRVEEVREVAAKEGPAPAELRDVGRAALERWTFEPAREGDVPVGAMFVQRFTFRRPDTFFVEVALPREVLAPRVAAALAERALAVVALPEAKGFAALSRPEDTPQLRTVGGLLIRLGPAEDPAMTGMTVRAVDPFRRRVPDKCGCTWRLPADGSDVGDFLKVLLPLLGDAAIRVRAVAPEGVDTLPAGLRPEGQRPDRPPPERSETMLCRTSG